MLERLLFFVAETVWPPLRWEREIRELDAKARVEVMKWYTEYWTKTWPEEQKEELNRPLVLTKLVRRRGATIAT